MSRFHFRLSLIISAVLILGALWFRAHSSKSAGASLIAIQDAQNNSEISNIISSEEFLAANPQEADTTLSPSSPLSNTDLVGRQLFSDYMSLVNNGQATANNLASLADAYSQNITSSSKTNTATAENIQIEEDTIGNLEIYSSSVFSVRNKYRTLVINASRGKNLGDSSSSNFITLMGTISDLYKAGANELTNIPVPASLADNHLRLINNYYSSSDAIKSLTESDKDPLKAYSALNIQAENSAEEETLLQNIQKTLMSNGIISESSS